MVVDIYTFKSEYTFVYHLLTCVAKELLKKKRLYIYKDIFLKREEL